MIKPIELYAQSWSKEDKQNIAPNITAILENFTRYSTWVASEIGKFST